MSPQASHAIKPFIPSESALTGISQDKIKTLFKSVDIVRVVILIAGAYFEQTICIEFKLVGN